MAVSMDTIYIEFQISFNKFIFEKGYITEYMFNKEDETLQSRLTKQKRLDMENQKEKDRKEMYNVRKGEYGNTQS